MGLDEEFSEIQRNNDKDRQEFEEFKRWKASQRSNPNQNVHHQTNQQFPPGVNRKLPNAITVLVLGICSIVGCFTYAIPGIVLGIIALNKHKLDLQIYNTDPARYETFFKMSRAGKICGTIGLICSCVFLIFLVIYFVFIISVISNLPPHY